MDTPIHSFQQASHMPNQIEDFDLNDINTCAGQGFEYVKTSLNKTSITPGDILLEYFNYKNNTNSNTILNQLFSLSILALNTHKNRLNEIQPEIFDKLLNYCIIMYKEKKFEPTNPSFIAA
tara:strand:- start:4733 stop:5095 length:363 start_codon:yes stop_codon:yes gene_type:complete